MQKKLIEQVAELTEELIYSERQKEKLKRENEDNLTSKMQAIQDKKDLMSSIYNQNIVFSREDGGVLTAYYTHPFLLGAKLILKSLKRKSWDAKILPGIPAAEI